MKAVLLLLSATLALVCEGAYSQRADTHVAPHHNTANASPLNTRYDSRLVKSWQQRTRQLYGDLFNKLELGDDKVEQLVNLIAEDSLVTSTWTMGAVTHNPGQDDAVRAAAILSEVERILGPEGFNTFLAYRSTLDERARVTALSMHLDSLGSPLKAEQEEKLVVTMATLRDSLHAELQSAPRTFERAQERVSSLNNFDIHLEQVCRSTLSGDQLEIVKDYFASRAQHRQEALERYRDQLAAGNTVPFWYSPD